MMDRERERRQASKDEGSGEGAEELGPHLNQSNMKVKPSQTLSNRTLYFQEKCLQIILKGGSLFLLC